MRVAEQRALDSRGVEVDTSPSPRARRRERSTDGVWFRVHRAERVYVRATRHDAYAYACPHRPTPHAPALVVWLWHLLYCGYWTSIVES